ncbi:hypothetical protein GSI_14498 [Ganoderma sinense ZZ0214-1]|uniref:DUF8212 domain-containing protein n=1 Tax=Ganoderma sinense ZZ0214-1 TaxID=1077348 RepID=A0A2G8RNV5_9APHY|nr:hypothetical protein GSI_14498 [Ganoderma sinense ZZ0214-1]
MYSWYASADVCYAYLADVPAGDDHWKDDSNFCRSRWFTRGWTLQELIAPLHVEFLCQDWTDIGSKHTLVDLIESVTKIEYTALLHLEPLDKFSVSQRLSWAANRVTTREEDKAYSLLGIFDINMPTLYDEGNLAFRRLQEQILQRIPDQSIFTWGRVHLQGSRILPEPGAPVPDAEFLGLECSVSSDHSSLLAMQPSLFTFSRSITAVPHHTVHNILHFQQHEHHGIEYTSTPYGIRTQFHMVPLSRYFDVSSSSFQYFGHATEQLSWYLAILGCEHKDHPGHLLGRFCYTTPSSSGIELLCPGSVLVSTRAVSMEFRYLATDLFPLSRHSLERCRPHIQLRTVYIAHAGRTASAASLIPHSQPYKTIKLVLLRETRDALLAQGYTAELRGPDRDHPATHQLTLSKFDGMHDIVVVFRHTLGEGGKRFTLDAKVSLVRMRGSPVDSGSDSPTNCRPPGLPPTTSTVAAVSWTDTISWYAGLKHERVSLPLDATSAGAPGPLTVDLSLEFAGIGTYFLRVDVRRTSVHPALCSPSPVELLLGVDGCVSSTESVQESLDAVVVFRHKSPKREAYPGW